ncbi:MAG: DUF4350 domain-containing protein [Acidobacteriota bacterium]|nr:DUF4350 domain-containing protein [Acidobacteriota bacterium]
MKRATTNSLIVLIILLVLVGLNLVLYTDPYADEETEETGSRSTYSARPYGTRAFYLLLQELGYRTIQFTDSLERLHAYPDIKALFIISPSLLYPYTSQELSVVEAWVKAGGHLIIIDREINWSLADGTIHLETYSKYKQWQRPRVLQPTPLTVGVNHIQLTEFAQGVTVHNTPSVAHIGDADGVVLREFRHGHGRIVLLGEPYIVANNGITQADNLTLALNLVRSLPAGIIAFDEHHHGYGLAHVTRQGLVGLGINLYRYFKSTPILWLLAQTALLMGAWVYSRGRRFARPMSLPQTERCRSLEYVAAMANLAQRHHLRGFVIETFHQSLERRLRSARKTTDANWEPGAPLNQGIAPDDLNHLLTLGRSAATAQAISDDELVKWARAIRQWEAHLGNSKL